MVESNSPAEPLTWVSAEMQGQAAFTDAWQRTLRVYPVTHGRTLLDHLNRLTGGVVTAEAALKATEATWPAPVWTGILSQHQESPVLSQLDLPAVELPALVAAEPQRADLAEALRLADVQAVLDPAQAVRFRLFTDLKEIVTAPGRDDRTYVIRPVHQPPEVQALADRNLAKYQSILPLTYTISTGADFRVYLSEYITGPYATEPEVAELRRALELVLGDVTFARLGSQGVSQIPLDLAPDNLIKRSDGQLVYIDRELLGL